MTSPSPSTSRSEPARVVLSLWLMVGFMSLYAADSVREWAEEDDHLRAARLPAVADGLVRGASAVGLGTVREELDAVRAALHRDPLLLVAPSYAVPAPPQQQRAAPAAAPGTSPRAAAASAHVAAPRVRRILLIGASSMQWALGTELESALRGYEGLDVLRFAKSATGLSRPDVFDWPDKFGQLLGRFGPDLVIVNFGGNDATAISLGKGKWLEYGSEEWSRTYAERLTGLVAQAKTHGAQMMVIGMPVMRLTKFNERMRRLNQLTRTAVEGAGGLYIDQFDLSATSDGRYRESVEIEGRQRLMRHEDGIHFSTWGARYVVAALMPRIERAVTLVPRERARAERHSFKSAQLGARLPYLAFVPRGQGRFPLVLLLHGAGDSWQTWSEHAHAEIARLADKHQLLVVTPDGGEAWYLDSTRQPASAYATVFARELIADIEASLPVTQARGIVGHSMGGHGAITLALSHPGLFRAAGSMSGVLDLVEARSRTALVALLGRHEDDPRAWEARSAIHMVRRNPEAARKLALRITCGASDRWAPVNRSFSRALTELGVAHGFDEKPGGHTWSYWEAELPAHLAWQAEMLRTRRQ